MAITARHSQRNEIASKKGGEKSEDTHTKGRKRVRFPHVGTGTHTQACARTKCPREIRKRVEGTEKTVVELKGSIPFFESAMGDVTNVLDIAR